MITIKSLGPSCFTLSAAGKTIIFDPFLAGNPEAICGPDDITVDAVLPSHGHSDHLGDTVAIANRLKCPVIGVFELCLYCARQGCEVAPMHIGGTRTFDFGQVKLTSATHGSGVKAADGTIEYTGPACGFVVTMGGKTIYYAGDTGLFGDMKLIGESVALDAAILPIGDCFTMGPDDALKAIGMLRPRVVIPTHFSAFDVIQQDADEWASTVRAMGTDCRVLRPGDEIEV
jgi:L-ascorbate metabolism protein UlaG (beta-lactamase superfamily)